MNNITLLDEKQIFGDKKSPIFYNEARCIVSDLSILLGVLPYRSASFTRSLDTRTGSYLTKTEYYDKVIEVSKKGEKSVLSKEGSSGIRPVINYSLIKHYVESEYDNKDKEVTCGYFPQTVLDEDIKDSIERKKKELLFIKNIILPEYDGTNIVEREHKVYEFNDEKYLNFVTENLYPIGKVLSNGEKIRLNYSYWLKFEPISWFVDNNIAVSKKILFFDNYNNYNNRDIFKNFYNYFISGDEDIELEKKALKERIVMYEQKIEEYQNKLQKATKLYKKLTM